MKLYYSPLACSLADHIALQEAGAAFQHERVDLKTKQTATGGDFTKINPKGYVPVLILDNGETLTENVAILDWIASRYPKFSVAGELGRSRVLEALTYISTELHRSFKPMWHPSDDAEKIRSREILAGLFRYLGDRLKGDYLFGNEPSVADFYLFVMLLWARKFEVPIQPALVALRDRLLSRPAVQAAMRDEGLDVA
jgi:glutathione S-transferase